MGALSKHIYAWEQIDTPEHLRTWIKEGVSIPFISSPVPCRFENRVANSEQKQFVNKKISELLTNGYISEVKNAPTCISPISCATKKNSEEKFRLISDMRHVNKYINVPKVRYEDHSQLPIVIKANDQYASIDLKDGFHHIKIKQEFRTYFGMEWNGNFYQWNVLNFGCAISPYIFTKLLRPVVQYLRENHVRCILYVDDFLICANEKLIYSHIELVRDTLNDLGWNINYKKSQLTPSTSIEYLGLILENDSNGVPVLKVPQKKINKLKKDINRVIKCGTVSARVLAKLAGQCNFLCKAVLPGRLMLRNIFKLIRTKVTWESPLTLTPGALSDLAWWQSAFTSWNGRTVLPGAVDATLTTDASGYGWGAHLGAHTAHGAWDPHMARKHSNVRELMAVLLALRALRPYTSNKTVSLLSDNITTVAYINHMGGPITELTDIAKDIWAELVQQNVTLVARHLSGKLNCQADSLSRITDKHEWMLAPSVFRFLDSTWGPHTVDRFASAATAQLPVYNARYLDPNGMNIDALAQQDWGTNNNFVNAPFRMLDKVIQIIRNQRAHATVIAPLWPAQTWFQDLLNLSISTPIRIFSKGIIQLNPATPEPLRNKKWKLYAWRICGNHKHFEMGGRYVQHLDYH